MRGRNELTDERGGTGGAAVFAFPSTPNGAHRTMTRGLLAESQVALLRFVLGGADGCPDPKAKFPAASVPTFPRRARLPARRASILSAQRIPQR